MSEITKEVVDVIWEDHVHTRDEVIESAERVLEPLLLAAVAMRNNIFGSNVSRSDVCQMWDDALAEMRRKQ